MAWNHPGEMKDARTSGRRMKAGGRGNVRPAVVGVSIAVIVAIGSIVLWLSMRAQDADERKIPVVEKAAFATVEPDLATHVAEVEPPKPEPPVEVDPNARPTKVGEVVNGYVLLPSGRLHRRQGVVTNFVANRPKGAYEIFDRSCDNEIACYLSLKPGDVLIGTPHYNGRFKADFIASLDEPIIIRADDTPEHAQLKRDVIAAKLELKAALDRGEDIEQIMLDTRQEIQDLMRYKMELQSQFNEMRVTDCQTEEDVENLLDACNKVLEQRGIAPIKFGPITRKKLLQQKEQR